MLTKEQSDARRSWLGGFSEGPITKVEEYETGYTVSYDHPGFGNVFGLPKEHGATPVEGDYIRVYTEGFSLIRGVDINGRAVFFKTDADVERDREVAKTRRQEKQREAYERDKEELEDRFDELPQVFKKRINWFRDHCPEDFDVEYLAYELICCTEAVKIARFFKLDEEKIKQWIYDKYPAVEGLEISDAHSGNTMGMAARLAFCFADDEEAVFFEHGALVPLVGCYAYGCAHPRPGVEEFAKKKGWNDDEN